MIPVNKELLTGTVPVNKELLTGTVPANKELLTGTVPVNNSVPKIELGLNMTIQASTSKLQIGYVSLPDFSSSD